MLTQKFEQVEKILKQIYLDIIISQIEESDEILKNICFTDRDVFGKEVIVVDYEQDKYLATVKKELSTISEDLKLPRKFFENLSKGVPILNYKCEDLVAKVIQQIKDLIISEYKIICPGKHSAVAIWETIKQLPQGYLKEIKFHKLSNWAWLDTKDGEFFKQVGKHPIYKTSLICYGAVTMSHFVATKITEILEKE